MSVKCAVTYLLQSWLLSLLFSPIFPTFPIFTQYNIIAILFIYLFIYYSAYQILQSCPLLWFWLAIWKRKSLFTVSVSSLLLLFLVSSLSQGLMSQERGTGGRERERGLQGCKSILVFVCYFGRSHQTGFLLWQLTRDKLGFLKRLMLYSDWCFCCSTVSHS